MGMALASEVPMGETNGHSGKKLVDQYRSFPFLLFAVMQQHHGKMRPVAVKTGIAATSLDRWIRGTSKVPEYRGIYQFCQAYDFNPGEVWELILRDQERYLTGKRVPLPEWEARTGPPKGVGQMRAKRRYHP